MYSQGFYEVKWPFIEYKIFSITKLEYKALQIERIKLQKNNIDKITLHSSCILHKDYPRVSNNQLHLVNVINIEKYYLKFLRLFFS